MNPNSRNEVLSPIALHCCCYLFWLRARHVKMTRAEKVPETLEGFSYGRRMRWTNS